MLDHITRLPSKQAKHLGTVVHICYFSTWEVDAVGSGVECYPQQHGKYKASVVYIKPC